MKNTIQILIGMMMISVWTLSCSNIGSSGKGYKRTSPNTLTSSTETFTISRVQADTPTPDPTPTPGATSEPVNFAIYFDPSRSTAPLTNKCKSNDGSCYCNYSWTESGVSNGLPVSYTRKDSSQVTGVQAYLVTCNGPKQYATEIDAGTTISVTVESGPSAASTFSSVAFNFVRTTGDGAGDFQDAMGSSFANIHRYSCYETNPVIRKIWNRVWKASADSLGANADETSVLMASSFCSGKDGDNLVCDGVFPAPKSNSTQSYFYNLYIRNTDRGQINSSNGDYVCPRVKEGLWAQSPDYYPMDSSFALALSKTAQFKVGIESFSKIRPNGAGATDEDSSCEAAAALTDPNATEPAGGGAATKGPKDLVKSCIGFAAKPNLDGSCPAIKNANGSLRPTYRLRRFITLYPTRYFTDGTPRDGSQPRDLVYVLDRPISAPGMDPSKPYTMRGPKPCPFAFYDEMGVLSDQLDPTYPGGMPGYAGSNFPGWNGTNVDGMEYPFFERNGNSCSAAVPLLNENKTLWSLTTVNRKNPVYKRLFVRPGQAWAPHYEEDTAFEACAPASDTFKDPPLHFAKDTSTGNISYCAEAYPSQNPFVAKVDRPHPVTLQHVGKVSNFTSHVVKNSSSAICTASKPDISSILSRYPTNPSGPTSASCNPATQATNGPAWHPNNYIVDSNIPRTGSVCSNASTYDLTSNTCFHCSQQTCDRTVAAPTAGTWSYFPLIARPERVEQAILSDTTYGCVVTYDNGLGKTGKTTPKEGCCGTSVQLWTGFDTSAVPNPNRANTTAHLEPDQKCQIPNY